MDESAKAAENGCLFQQWGLVLAVLNLYAAMLKLCIKSFTDQ
jgi:hypothetical protein